MVAERGPGGLGGMQIRINPSPDILQPVQVVRDYEMDLEYLLEAAWHVHHSRRRRNYHHHRLIRQTRMSFHYTSLHPAVIESRHRRRASQQPAVDG